MGGGVLGLRHQQDVRLPYHPGVRLQHSHNPWNLFVVSIAKLPGGSVPSRCVSDMRMFCVFLGGDFLFGGLNAKSFSYLFPFESFTWGWNDVIWFDLSQLDLFWILSIFHSTETIRAKAPKKEWAFTTSQKNPVPSMTFKRCLMWNLGGDSLIVFSPKAMKWKPLQYQCSCWLEYHQNHDWKIKLLLSFNRICVRLTPEEGEENILRKLQVSLHMNGIESSSSLSWSSSNCCGFWKCFWLPLRYPYIYCDL